MGKPCELEDQVAGSQARLEHGEICEYSLWHTQSSMPPCTVARGRTLTMTARFVGTFTSAAETTQTPGGNWRKSPPNSSVCFPNCTDSGISLFRLSRTALMSASVTN